ncbi:MAG: DUF4389 domain-containing protein [Spirochaetales bacterium]|nr:DUF4389 domain-containing protein [Spirochaetales bacterium]
MKLSINYQESNSRGELLLRSFLGWLYIVIPHTFLMCFACIWLAILNFIKFWIVIFTGHIPDSTYEFQKKMMHWQLRLNSSIFNLRDGYPAIGPGGSNSDITLEFENPEKVNRGLVIVRLLFGPIYILIPHGFCLSFVGIAASFVLFIAWWAILFTGKYPEKMFNFIVKYLRWNMRVILYMEYYTDEYPPFNGRE